MKNSSRNPKLMAPCAYDFFKRYERTGKEFTSKAFCDYTGYKQGTFEGYIPKKYHIFLHEVGPDRYIVNGFSQISKTEFLGWHWQKIRPPASPQVIVQEVDRYYTIVANSDEMWIIVVALVVAGIWWG